MRKASRIFDIQPLAKVVVDIERRANCTRASSATPVPLGAVWRAKN